jgi:hypothetical protein
MIMIKATVVWRGAIEGGLTTRPYCRIQPSFAVAGQLIISQVFAADGSQEMPVGEECLVELRLPYGENFRDQIRPGLVFTLNVGARVVATGSVVSLT